MDGSVARWFLSKLVSRTGLLGLKTSTTYFSRTSIVRASVRRISINTDHSIGIYSYPDNLHIIGEGVGRGTLYLYEMVGEPYLSNVGLGMFIRKNEGRTIHSRTKDVVPQNQLATSEVTAIKLELS